MKLIIDVDEKIACEGFERPFTDTEVNILLRAIGNGTPYETVTDFADRCRECGKMRKGHWIDNMDLGYHVSICSKCNWRGHGDTYLIYKPNYCPNCGAKMEERDE